MGAYAGWLAISLTVAALGAGRTRTYTTSFRRDENPISERGRWTNGQTSGLDWANVRTMAGLAYGLESGAGTGKSKYDDATALLTGKWSPDQMAEAVVHSVHPRDDVSEEVELRLRSSLSAHRATGYEILFRCAKSGGAYAQIVRWNGPLGDFTYLATAGGSQYGVTTGDVVRASIAGNVITAYINGVQVLRATDDTFSSGAPGMGFFLAGATGLNGDYGFTRFTASDLPPRTVPAPGHR